MTHSQYRAHDWLTREIERILEFYHPACVDDAHGGFVAQLDPDTGEIYDPDSKHLVATARFTVNFAVASRLGGPEWALSMAESGVDFLSEHHYDPQHRGYDWILNGTQTVEGTRVAYGHAFVLLAYARATEAGVDAADTHLEETYQLLMSRFWEPEHTLYKSEFSRDWSQSAPYRGQNANMHACEAMLAAYEATDRDPYLKRAREIGHTIAVDLAEETGGLIWEHYTENWEHDFEYNRDEPEDKFRPWGYQPGHHIEWAKLLAVLDRYTDEQWPLDRAETLFEEAVNYGWDTDRGGFYYTFDREGRPLIKDKYRWPVAEGIGAVAALYERTGREKYLNWYDRLWKYAEDCLIAPGRNWYLRLSPDNERYENERGVEVEPGYHPIGACFEALRSFTDESR